MDEHTKIGLRMCADKANPDHKCVHEVDIAKMGYDIDSIKENLSAGMTECTNKTQEILRLLQNGMSTELALHKEKIKGLIQKTTEIDKRLKDNEDRQDKIIGRLNVTLVSVVEALLLVIVDILVRIYT